MLAHSGKVLFAVVKTGVRVISLWKLPSKYFVTGVSINAASCLRFNERTARSNGI